jgi:hypothetical protein
MEKEKLKPNTNTKNKINPTKKVGFFVFNQKTFLSLFHVDN